MTADTADLSYWLNWRFLLCGIWLLIAIIVAALIIWHYECSKKSRKGEQGEDQRETPGSVYQDEAWTTCSRSIHPGWLLGFRLIAFCTLFALLLTDVIVNGVGIYYFYTQWTFALVTFYFGVGCAFSVHGCLRCWKIDRDGKDDFDIRDSEKGIYVPPALGEHVHNTPTTLGNLNSRREPLIQKPASFWGYTFQIIYQMCAGAVTLTDFVYWLIIYPFLTDKNYKLYFLVVCMHSVNAVFLLGEIILNNLRFPFFRIAYFALWTSVFVIFQWIIHMCVSLWWPYPFLDLSSPYAPLWYLAVGLLHLPCYGIIALIMKAKKFWLSRLSSESYMN